MGQVAELNQIRCFRKDRYRYRDDIFTVGTFFARQATAIVHSFAVRHTKAQYS